MTRQIAKMFGGYTITYHSDRKTNKFVITFRGKVVEKYGDYYSCVMYCLRQTGNFEEIKMS